MSCFAKKLTKLVFPANTFTQYHYQHKRLFENIVGYDNVKRLFRMALESNHGLNKSRTIRDCLRIGRMAKSIEDVNWLTSAFSF
jgi:hypothetical protein